MSTKTHLILAPLFIISLSGTVLGQRAKLSGEVFENGVRKPNINVMVVGAGEKVTDNDGRFRLMLPNKFFIPGQPITIRVNGWKVFDPMFGESTAQDASFEPASIIISIIRPRSTLAHQDRQRLGAIVAAMQDQKRILSRTVLAFQKDLTLQTSRVEALTEEVSRVREENQKYAFLRRYAEEYEVPLEAIKNALDDWARNKKAEDDLEAARQAYWRGDYAQVVEITNRSETMDDELMRENRQLGLKLNRRRLDKYNLKLSALSAQSDVKGLYDAAKKLESLFENREISKEDFPAEWAENKLAVGALAFLMQAVIDLKKPTLTGTGKPELIAESLRALRSVEDYYSPVRSPGLWATMKIMSALAYRYQELIETRDTKYLHEIIGALNEVLNARDASGKVLTAERFPTEWSLAQSMLGCMFTTLSSNTAGTEGLKYLRAVIDVQREVLSASSAGARMFTPEKFPQQWAQSQASLASALLDLSRRTQGADSLAYLKEAIAAYKALFDATGSNGTTFFASYFGGNKVYTPAKFPQAWAKSQSQLGSALFELSKRVTGTESLTALSEAVAAYRAASGVRKSEINSEGVKFASPDELLQEWVAAQSWLSVCLLELSRRTAGPDSLTHLTASIAANRAILEESNDGKKIITPERFPQGWAGAQIGLGNGLVDLSMKTPGADGLTYARNAIAAYKAVLTAESGGSRVFVPEKFPVEWLFAQRGVGNASAEANRRVGGPTELSYLIDTIGAYKAALSASVGGVKVFTPDASPTDWVLTQSALGTALTELSLKTQGPDSLKYQNEAIAAYEESFAASGAGGKVLTPESFPIQWALNKISLGQALIVRSLLTAGDDGVRDLNDAIAASRAVLEASNQGAKLFTLETFPAGWVRAQINLGTALMGLGHRTTPPDRNRALEAIEAVKAVLSANKAGARIVTPEVSPDDWSAAQSVLASGYALLGEWDRTSDVDVEILQHFPDNRFIYQNLALIYSERLFMFEQAFDLHQQWLMRHPNDVEAQIGFATAHFKTGRFSECARRIEILLGTQGLPANTAIGLRTVEIANLIALNRQHEVLGKLDALIKEVKDQPASFRLAWGFDGTKNRIDQVENIKPQRAWLHQLLDAFQSKDRDALLEALRKARASWEISSRSATLRIRKPRAEASSR